MTFYKSFHKFILCSYFQKKCLYILINEYQTIGGFSMWKLLGILIVILIAIIPGALIGALVGAVYLPAKVWALFGNNETSDVSVHNDEI